MVKLLAVTKTELPVKIQPRELLQPSVFEIKDGEDPLAAKISHSMFVQA